jgi:uncharacterized zinc-type alcohol dehydrogenase-like protein
LWQFVNSRAPRHLKKGWGSANFPLVTGHEVIGHVHAVGKNVKTVKVGDRVGVGPLAGACGACEWCGKDYEQLCPKRVFTYNSKDAHGRPRTAATPTALWCRTSSRSRCRRASTAPTPRRCCVPASPSSRRCCATQGSKPGQKVAIIAIGGLGHLAVMFAAKFGHHVTAISRGTDKKDLCHQLGAEAYVDSTDKDAMAAISNTFDFVLDCSSFDGNLTTRLGLPKPQGTLCVVGLPDEPFTFQGFNLLGFERKIVGSLVGSPKDIADMFDFVLKHKLQVMVSEVAPMSEVNRVHADVKAGKPRFRVTLKNDL